MQKKQISIVAIIAAVIFIAALAFQVMNILRNSGETTEPAVTMQGNSETSTPQTTSLKTTTLRTTVATDREATSSSPDQASTISGEQAFITKSTVDPNGVVITITNHRKDKVGLRVTVSVGKRNAQGYAEVDPNETKELKIEFPQRKAKETLVLEYRVGTVSGNRGEDISETLFEDRSEKKREISEEFADAWNKGTFETVYESIDYHFKKHGEEVDAKNIVDYLEKSVAFRNQILADRNKMKQSELEKIYTVKESRGKLPAHKYKHKENKRYAIITDEDGKILSFGK